MSLTTVESLTFYHPPFLVMSCFLFAIGACVGSFLNVCIYRIPNGESIVSPSSHCPTCCHKIRIYENIPILSWFLLRGKCSNCQSSIAKQYFMIEAATGLLFLTIWVRVYNKLWPHSVVLAFSVLVSVLIAVTLIDIRHRIIPNQLVFAGLLSGLIIGIVFPEVHSYSQMGITNYYLSVYKPISYYFFEHATQLIPGSRQAYSILFAFGDSLLGVIFGGGILLTTLELGKLVCGKRKVTLSEPATLTLTTRGFSANDLDFRAWEDLFPRESDKLIVTGSVVEFNFPPEFSSIELD